MEKQREAFSLAAPHQRRVPLAEFANLPSGWEFGDMPTVWLDRLQESKAFIIRVTLMRVREHALTCTVMFNKNRCTQLYIHINQLIRFRCKAHHSIKAVQSALHHKSTKISNWNVTFCKVPSLQIKMCNDLCSLLLKLWKNWDGWRITNPKHETRATIKRYRSNHIYIIFTC